jgi:ribonuclease HI
MYTDGAVINNPGEGGIGVVILDNDKPIIKISEYIGKTTNNVAEYYAIVRGLEEINKIKKNKNDEIKIFSDSELIINQLTGNYRIKDKKLQKFAMKIMSMISKFKNYTFEYISREKNKETNKLAQSAISLKCKRIDRMLVPENLREGKSEQPG